MEEKEIKEEVLETEEQPEENTEEEIELDPVAKLEQEVAEVKDQLLRNRAELENFKRRTQEERMKERKYAHSGILTKFIDLHDNFARALAYEDYADVAALKDGLKSIMTQMDNILEGEQVSEIKALGEVFDPNLHQAVMTSNDEDVDDEIITEELQKGYVYKDRTLRPAMVKVNHKN